MNSKENDCRPAARRSRIAGAGPTGMTKRLPAPQKKHAVTPLVRFRDCMRSIFPLASDTMPSISPGGLLSASMATQAATGSQANLGRIRTEVARALEKFLARQRETLGAVGDDLLPCLDAMAGLLAGGKRLRPAFCYWGWRAAGGRDCAEIYSAASALELLQASALV